MSSTLSEKTQEDIQFHCWLKLQEMLAITVKSLAEYNLSQQGLQCFKKQGIESAKIAGKASEKMGRIQTLFSKVLVL
jgi:hypothetical protein